MFNSISINPNRIAAYHAPDYENQIQFRGKSLRNLKLNHRKGAKMSAAAKKRLKNAINWMVYLSPKRTVFPKGRKPLRDFSISFITLTLPAKQMHSHKEIKSRCLNNFLTIIRKKFGVQNYLWKAELQKNGNIHFHITIDRWIHYMAIRNIWNSSINLLGYVDHYASMFRDLSFDDYANARKLGGCVDLEAIRRAWNYGNATNWENPNTTDVKKVKEVKKLAAYLSKYLAKDPAENGKSGIISDSAESFEGRKWFLSQSLSRMKSVRLNYSMRNINFIKKIKRLRSTYRVEGDFYQCLYFRFTKLQRNLQIFLNEELTSYAIQMGYPFPSGFQNPRVSTP